MLGFFINIFKKNSNTIIESVPESDLVTESETNSVIVHENMSDTGFMPQLETETEPEHEHESIFDGFTSPKPILEPTVNIQSETSQLLSDLEKQFQKVLKDRREESEKIKIEQEKKKEIELIINSSTSVISEWDLLKRYIMLGVDHEKPLSFGRLNDNETQNKIECLEKLLKDPENYQKILDLITEYIPRAYKKATLIYILARCCASKEAKLRSEAYKILPILCNIPTHLFTFVEMYENICKTLNNSTGWNKLQKQAIAKWYLDKDPRNLVYLVTKYKNRNNWTHADILRLSHIKYPNSIYDTLFRYITKGYEEYLNKLEKLRMSEDMIDSCLYIKEYIEGYEELKTLDQEPRAIELINKFNFVREHIPTSLLNSPDIWNALAQEMPMVAMLRNLNKLNAVKLFEKYPETKNKLITRLNSESDIKASKVHPLQVLISLKMNCQNDGFDKELKFALNTAFKHAFKNVEDTGKRFLIALDVSGSMSSNTVNGINCMSACEISCAMAMIIKATQKSCDIMGFADTFRYLDLNPDDTLDKNLNKIHNQNFGRTDCSLPFRWSLENNKQYDAVIVFTDNETNSNIMKPVDVLRVYRNKTGINCKLIVVATSTNDISIADRSEPMNMLDISGFSADTPMIINDFIRL